MVVDAGAFDSLAVAGVSALFASDFAVSAFASPLPESLLAPLPVLASSDAGLLFVADFAPLLRKSVT